jgi:hypothetical protein
MLIHEIMEARGLPRVTVNPTKSQLQALLRTSARRAKFEYAGEPGRLRGVVSEDRLSVWDAYAATHQMMGYGDVRDDDPEMLIEIDHQGVHSSLPSDFKRLRVNVHLQRVFGGEPPIVEVS